MHRVWPAHFYKFSPHLSTLFSIGTGQEGEANMDHGTGWRPTCKSQQWISKVKVGKKSTLQAHGCLVGDARGVLHTGRDAGGVEAVQFWDSPAEPITAGTEGAAKLLPVTFVFRRHLCTVLPLQAGPVHPSPGWACNRHSHPSGGDVPSYNAVPLTPEAGNESLRQWAH